VLHHSLHLRVHLLLPLHLLGLLLAHRLYGWGGQAVGGEGWRGEGGGRRAEGGGRRAEGGGRRAEGGGPTCCSKAFCSARMRT
jgi:hypothetical protein